MSKPSTDAVSLPITVSNPSGSRSILLVHGLTSAAGTWWQLVPRLTALDFAVTTVDLRGHGLAPKADSYRLEDFARDLVQVHPLDGSPWDVVVGHSLGAASAVAAAASDPDWTKRLVLLDPAIMLADDQADLYGTEWPKQVAPATLEQIQQAEPGAHPIFHAQRLLFTQQVTPEVVSQVAHDMKPWDARRQLRELQVPVLVLSADPTVDPTFLQPEILAEYSSLPAVTQHIIVGAGHSVHRDDLEQTFNQLRDFFAQQGL